jgi:hypothetical protein
MGHRSGTPTVFQAKCTRCGAGLTIPDSKAGELVKCPSCRRSFLAPDDGEPVEEDFSQVPPRPVSPGVVASRSVYVLTGLVLFAVLAVLGTIGVIKLKQHNAAADKAPAPTVQKPAPGPDVWRTEEPAGQRTVVAETSTAKLLLAVVIVAGYLTVIYLVGVWMGVAASLDRAG